MLFKVSSGFLSWNFGSHVCPVSILLLSYYCSGFISDLDDLCTLRVIRTPLQEMLTIVPCFLHLDSGSHCCSLESQSLTKGSVDFSRLLEVSKFSSHLFLNFFRMGSMDCFLLAYFTFSDRFCFSDFTEFTGLVISQDSQVWQH